MTAQPARSAQPDPHVDPELSPRNARLLEFEREWRRHSAVKEDAIRRDLALSPVRYYQLLDVVIDSPAAVRYDPMLVGQLQRSRQAKSASRARRTAIAAEPVAQRHSTEETTY